MKQPQQPRRAAARLSRQRGQAYAEYLVVTMVLIAALIVATVDMPVGQANKALKRLWPTFNGLTFTDTNVLLTNTWSPDGRSGAVNLFTSAVPAANATLVKPSTYQGLKPYAPEADTVQFGRVQPDVVPADRLSP